MQTRSNILAARLVWQALKRLLLFFKQSFLLVALHLMIYISSFMYTMELISYTKIHFLKLDIHIALDAILDEICMYFIHIFEV